MHKCDVYGDASWTSNVLVLGPVNPVWQGGDFCQPLLELLAARRQRAIVLDAIAFIGDGRDGAEACVDRLLSFIGSRLPPIDMIAGYALGGTLALKLAPQLPDCARVLCLSGPGHIDPPLRGKLQALIDLLGKGDLDGCLAALSAMVAPAGQAPGAGHRDRIARDEALAGCGRMIKGFSTLLELDARPGLAGYRGQVLCMLGQHSQLASIDNLAIAPAAAGSRQRVALVPGAGMRILVDNPEFSVSTINEWLENDK